ncbi:MAG: IcmT/TraK family protein [Chromatiales bacterium]|jgi:hypothetical protein
MWREASRTATVFGINAIAFVPYLLFLLHWRWWTFLLATSCVVALALLARYGMNPMASLRLLRARIGQFINRGVRPNGRPNAILRRLIQ